MKMVLDNPGPIPLLAKQVYCPSRSLVAALKTSVPFSNMWSPDSIEPIGSPRI